MSIQFLTPGDEPPEPRAQVDTYALRSIRETLASAPGVWAVINEAPYAHSSSQEYREVMKWASSLRRSVPREHRDLVIEVAMRSDAKEGWCRVYARAVTRVQR